jgi:Divergent InlB B-repeat domain
MRITRFTSVMFLSGALLVIGARVEAASLSLGWNAPTTNTDGTQLSDLDGYRVYMATSVPAPTCPSSSYIFVASPTSAPSPGAALSYRLASLTAGATYSVAITAVDLGGLESQCTAPVSAQARADITVSPTTAIDFGTRTVGTATDISFTVQNVTTTSLVGSASVGSPFSIVSGGSFSLAPGASQPVVVRLLASTAGTFASNVNFSANGDSLSRTVTGAATASATTSATLTVVRSGTGSVSSPAGIECGSICTATVTTPTSVTLTAEPATGWTFTGWSGGGCSGTATCSLTVTSNTTVSATFTATTTTSADATPREIRNCSPGLKKQGRC